MGFVGVEGVMAGLLLPNVCVTQLLSQSDRPYGHTHTLSLYL